MALIVEGAQVTVIASAIYRVVITKAVGGVTRASGFVAIGVGRCIANGARMAAIARSIAAVRGA